MSLLAALVLVLPVFGIRLKIYEKINIDTFFIQKIINKTLRVNFLIAYLCHKKKFQFILGMLIVIS